MLFKHLLTSQEKFEGSKPSPEDNQKARKQRLHEYCLTHMFNEKPEKEELQYFAVDNENKILFCGLQKVASSTWFRLLRNALGVKGGRWAVFPRLSEYSEEERSFILKTYFKFFFVREPLERLLSAYKHKFIRTPDYTKEIRKIMVQALRPQDYEPEGENYVSFSEYIQYFSSNISRNQHWRQYEKICHPCVINYDFIGHFETMGADGPVVLKMAGIDDRVTFPRIGQSTGSEEVLEYYSQVPPRYIKQLGEQYRNDFEMFGYEYLGSVKKLFSASISDD